MAPREALLLATLASSQAQRLHVINACGSEPVWIAGTAKGFAGTTRIDAGGSHDFDIDAHPTAQRYWPKYGCGSDGQRCRIGDSGGPGQTCGAEGCAPPVDSKFEITVARNGVDWWDTSAVDGYTVPFKVELSGCGTRSPNIDCSHLSLSDCPTENIENVGSRNLILKNPSDGTEVGCYSPCSKLTTRNWHNPDGDHTPADSIGQPYCCPTWTPQQCRAGPSATMQYTKSIHSHCPHTYAYSYDDADGLHTCPTGTHYTWTVYCPTGGSGPSARRRRSDPSPRRRSSSGWQPCHGRKICCDPHTSTQQFCPGHIPCQECGGGNSCHCPDTMGSVVV